MNVQYALITRTFRGMAAASPWIPALSKSLGQTQPITFRFISAFGPINPTFAYSSSAWERIKVFMKGLVNGSSEYNNNDKDESFGKNVTSDTAQRSSEPGHDTRSRAFPKFSRPRPERVPWHMGIANRVYFTGMIGRPVEFKFTQSGKASARTSLAVITSPEDKPMWLQLLFWNKLAETAAQHLNKYDIVYVSGFLKSQMLAGEDGQQRIFYQVITQTLNFIQTEAPTFPQQVDVKMNAPSPAFSQHTVVNENTWSPVISQPTSTNRGTCQYQQSPVMSSSSGNEGGQDASIMQSQWEAFFANPDDWWDNRRNKKYSRSPDFRNKDTRVGLWIHSNSTPSWVKTMLLARWDSKMNVPEE